MSPRIPFVCLACHQFSSSLVSTVIISPSTNVRSSGSVCVSIFNNTWQQFLCSNQNFMRVSNHNVFANKAVASWQRATRLYLDGKHVSQIIQLNGYLLISLGEIIECTSHSYRDIFLLGEQVTTNKFSFYQ